MFSRGSSGPFTEGEGFPGLILKIVVSGNNVNFLSAILKLIKQLKEFFVAFLFTVKGKVACDKHRVSLVSIFQPLKHAFVYALGFCKALLLVVHKVLVFLSAAA